MIGPLLVVLVVAVAAGGVGLWLGIVVFAPRLQRRIDGDGAAQADEPASESRQAAKEPDARAD